MSRATILVPPHDLRLLLLYSDSPLYVLVGVVLVCHDIFTRRKKLAVKPNLEC